MAKSISAEHKNGLPHAGAPSKYKPAYCAAVVADMAAGYSLTAFAGSIGVCRNTLANWQEAYPEFKAAVECAQAKRTRKWEGIAIDIAVSGTGGPGASSIVIFALKNVARDEWADTSKHELTGKDGGAMKLEQVGADAESFTCAIAGLATRAAEDAGASETQPRSEGAA